MIHDARLLFLKQRRFDLIFKFLYLKYPDNQFVRAAYLESIRAFNDFHEDEPSDGKPKNSPADFLKSFDALYESIKGVGYNESKGLIPIGDNGEISDGAHRLSVCAYLNKGVATEPDGRRDLYDYRFFICQKMDPKIMDFGALEYVKLNPNAYIVNLHSVTDQAKDTEVVSILEKYGFVYYKKSVRLTFDGYVNLKKLSYGSFWEKEPWIGTVSNKFAGAQMHARECMGKSPLRVFVFVCDDIQKVIKAKSEIRDLFKIGNFSIHINDSREEAIWLAETYFNENSLRMINRRPFIYEDIRFDQMIEDLKVVAASNNVDIECLCGAGSTPFGVYGLRQCSDFDFLYNGPCSFDVQTETLSNHDSELKYYPFPKKEIIENPNYHFYYHGLKFITLDVLLSMKQKRHEVPKDVKDCKMIKRFERWGCAGAPFRVKVFEKIKNGERRTIVIFGFIKIRYRRRRKKICAETAK